MWDGRRTLAAVATPPDGVAPGSATRQAVLGIIALRLAKHQDTYRSEGLGVVQHIPLRALCCSGSEGSFYFPSRRASLMPSWASGLPAPSTVPTLCLLSGGPPPCRRRGGQGQL
ncbi:hypothetical protein PsYK624_108360 [Phanerochaete sordida]|uniref:Uncharacterized protein n=1 Tax=Phanerochaete sordida TaxID=48140 RepID=A0A9P3GJC7_9APHY|nr:hypothetical protein PsYK624_108360 [Phanerochaete sordida]